MGTDSQPKLAVTLRRAADLVIPAQQKRRRRPITDDRGCELLSISGRYQLSARRDQAQADHPRRPSPDQAAPAPAAFAAAVPASRGPQSFEDRRGCRRVAQQVSHVVRPLPLSHTHQLTGRRREPRASPRLLDSRRTGRRAWSSARPPAAGRRGTARLRRSRPRFPPAAAPVATVPLPSGRRAIQTARPRRPGRQARRAGLRPRHVVRRAARICG